MATQHKAGYSFCIITDKREPTKLEREIESIKALNIPEYEINIEVDDTPPYGRTGALRNRVCRRASFDHIVMADDDLVFHSDFFEGLKQFGEGYDVMVCKILNPDGSRFYDWKILIDEKNYLLDYDKTDPNLALSSTLLILKQWVFERVQMDDNLGYYEGEDTDYGQRLKNAGMNICLNPYCSVTHEAPYRQIGRSVVRMDFWGTLAFIKYRFLHLFNKNV
jgi:Glycosyltransferases, probably involved in cell wall biogenesis